MSTVTFTVNQIITVIKSIFFIKTVKIKFCNVLGTRYQSLDRGPLVVDPHEREFIPIREPRDRSRDRSLERGLYLEEELYGRPSRQSPSQIRKLKSIYSFVTY